MKSELDKIIDHCKQIAFDMEFSYAKEWKKQDNQRTMVGHMPIYFPREIVHAMGGLPVGIMGTGDQMQIIKGDAYYQSYICHIPRGIVEMALNKNLDDFDAFVFPSICDVIRNLSGLFQIIREKTVVKYLDYPQNFEDHIGGKFYRQELEEFIGRFSKANNVKLEPEQLNESIKLYNQNRSLIEGIYDLRQDHPWRLAIHDLYCILRAGLAMPVEEHNKMLREVYDLIREDIGHPMDKIRVLVSGAFCEQPPLGLIKIIEMAGCYIIEDDFMLGSRWILGDVSSDTNDPLGALVDAYLKQSTFSSSVYDVGNPKTQRLVDLARKRKVDGVIFAAASFCDPALLDRPELQKALDDANIRHIGFMYNENTGQFKVIKEQVGAFSDSIKLWEEPTLK